jgi:hypothetical protein
VHDPKKLIRVLAAPWICVSPKHAIAVQKIAWSDF